MIRDRNIVCLASSWFDHPTSKHHIMRRLAERNHVLWVNFHASRRPQLTRRDTALGLRRLVRAWAGVQRVAPRIDVLSPLLIPLPESRLARVVNTQTVARQIRAALRRLPTRLTQLWLFTPDLPELIERLPTECVLYYCVDDFAAFDGFNAALMEQLEARTIAGSDVVVATSQKLYEERRTRHGNVHLVPHGVDFEHFAAAPRLAAEAVPDDLKRIPHPIFGYMGTVSDWLDQDLIRRAARARPDWSFVLIGDVRCDVQALAHLPNVHRLGGRPYELLPAYCRGFDVGLIPFRMNRLVRAVNPIKLREYLAAGLPVVSAPMAEVRAYAPAVLTAESPGEFLAACQAALEMAAEGSALARQALVSGDSWRQRVERLSQIVAGTTRRTTPRTPAARELASRVHST